MQGASTIRLCSYAKSSNCTTIGTKPSIYRDLGAKLPSPSPFNQVNSLPPAPLSQISIGKTRLACLLTTVLTCMHACAFRYGDVTFASMNSCNYIMPACLLSWPLIGTSLPHPQDSTTLSIKWLRYWHFSAISISNLCHLRSGIWI